MPATAAGSAITCRSRSSLTLEEQSHRWLRGSKCVDGALPPRRRQPQFSDNQICSFTQRPPTTAAGALPVLTHQLRNGEIKQCGLLRPVESAESMLSILSCERSDWFTGDSPMALDLNDPEPEDLVYAYQSWVMAVMVTKR